MLRLQGMGIKHVQQRLPHGLQGPKGNQPEVVTVCMVVSFEKGVCPRPMVHNVDHGQLGQLVNEHVVIKQKALASLGDEVVAMA